MSANPIFITQTLSTITCCHANCGVVFGIPQTLEMELRRSHERFFCPHGHGQSFPGESDIEKAQRLQRDAEWRAGQARMEAERERKEKQEIRLRHRNLKQRVKRGKCPVKNCRQKFPTLKEHLKSHKRFR